MSTSEQRERLIDLQDRLIDLLVQQDEERRAENWDREREITEEISDAMQYLGEIHHSIVQDNPVNTGDDC